jgi:hypothetical protein
MEQVFASEAQGSDATSALQQAPPARERHRGLVAVLCTLATLQVVWFYLFRVPPYIDYALFEAGQERIPFQTRVLLMWPLRWAHGSGLCTRIAGFITMSSGYIPGKVLPEYAPLLVIDGLALMTAGLVARSLYRAYSPTRVLLPFVYPLVLTMTAVQYCLLAWHDFGFLYDLPSLGLFSLALWLLHKRRTLLFAAVFVIATLNRETAIFLLLFYLATEAAEGNRLAPKKLLAWKPLVVTLALAGFWIAWRIHVTRLYRGHTSEADMNLGVNIVYFLYPSIWPQLAGVAAYTLPLLALYQKHLHSMELRLWLAIAPVWLAVMLIEGQVVEIRLFGELIPLFAVVAALIAEGKLRTSFDLAAKPAAGGPALP